LYNKLGNSPAYLIPHLKLTLLSLVYSYDRNVRKCMSKPQEIENIAKITVNIGRIIFHIINDISEVNMVFGD
jgi:hypothetical protein